MKVIVFLVIALLNISSNAVAASQTQPTNKNINAALREYLLNHGDLCVGKFDWPIDVSQKDIAMNTRDAVQMPVLERLGLVESSIGVALRQESDETQKFVPVKHYALTDAGKKFYINKIITSVSSSGKTIVHTGDLCAATLSFDKLVRWDKPMNVGDHQELIATYTYKVSATDWAQNKDIQKVFPMVARIIDGAGTMELKQRLRLTDKTWTAVNPQE